MLEIKFEKDDDGSGCGILMIVLNGIELIFIPITNSCQLEQIDELVGTYEKS